MAVEANKGWTTTLPGPGQSEGRGTAPGSDGHDLLGRDLPGRGVDLGAGPPPAEGWPRLVFLGWICICENFSR